VSIRFYLKLSKGWGWSGQDFHPHLTHFMTTENPKWHGPAASHLTLFGPRLLPHAQKLWIDELAVGTKRIGPLTSLPK